MRASLHTRMRSPSPAWTCSATAARLETGATGRGTALSVVVIDKLPFAAPDDPLLKARLEEIRARGGNPFFEEQVPQAVIALKQGAGRLIRDEADFGVVMICDPRLVTKGYGRAFTTSLPPMKRTRELEEVQQFLTERLATAVHDSR
jgi:ATP-dependent DNA helicase DinG